MDHDMTAWDHLGRVHVIIDFHLREQRDLLPRKPKSQVPAAVTRTPLHAPPVLDLGHDHTYQLAEEMVHILPPQLTRNAQMLTGADAERGNTLLGFMGRRADIGDGLEDHAGDVQVGRVFDGAGDHGVHGDALDLGDVAEGDRFAEEGQDFTASWAAQRAVLEIRAIADPAA